MKIFFKTIKDVYEFVKISQCLSFEIELCQGRYVVDGKSLMGIFSLDLARPINVNSHGNNIATDFEQFIWRE